MNSKVKKALLITKNVIVWLMIVFTVLMTVFTLFSVIFIDKEDRTFFGMRMMVVLSGSMETDFPEGDLIFTVSVNPNDLEPGKDIITYISQEDGPSFGKRITHAIRAKTTTADGTLESFITYGTTTGKDDAVPVLPGQVQGKYIGSIPKVGYFIEFLKSPVGYIFCILLPFLLIIGYQVYNCIILYRSYRGVVISEMKAEREKLAKEKEELKKLLALKEELEAKEKAITQEAPPEQLQEIEANTTEPEQAQEPEVKATEPEQSETEPSKEEPKDTEPKE